jgi:predicted acetyltransferase
VSPARAARAPALRYRPARRTDIETLVDLSLRAYRVSSAEARREFFSDHPRFGLRDVRVGELDGETVAALVLYPLAAWVRGTKLPVTGIGSVAVSPEHRRRGIADALVRAALREMRQRGDVLSMLYAFRADFYRRYGWGLVEMPTMLSVPPAMLPASDEARRVRRLRLPDRPLVQDLYERHARERGHFALARRPEWWERRLWGYEGEWVVYERGRSQIEGYLHAQVDSGEGPWKLVVTVNEYVAHTPAAHRGLTGYLHGLRDQVVEVVVSTPADAPWLAQFADAANLRGDLKLSVVRSSGHVGYGAMLRVLDVKGALEALPVSPQARGEVVLEVSDGLLPQNERAWRVHARDGRLTVRAEGVRSGASRDHRPRLATTAETLAILAAGAMAPARAVEVGLAHEVRGAAELLDHWFRARPVFVMPMNGF